LPPIRKTALVCGGIAGIWVAVASRAALLELAQCAVKPLGGTIAWLLTRTEAILKHRENFAPKSYTADVGRVSDPYRRQSDLRRKQTHRRYRPLWESVSGLPDGEQSLR